MANRFLNWLDRRGSSRMIERVDAEGVPQPYLKRFYLFRSKKLDILIHQFWDSDGEDLHDHPWDNITHVLKGAYWEHGPGGGATLRRAGDVVRRMAEEPHSIRIPAKYAAGEVWTLFICRERRRRWGFFTQDGWVDAEEYGQRTGNPVKIRGEGYRLKGRFFPKVIIEE